MRYALVVALALFSGSTFAGDCVGGNCAVKVLKGAKTVVTHPLQSVKRVGKATRNTVRRVGSGVRNLGR